MNPSLLDLVTLKNVQDWLASSNLSDSESENLQRCITAASVNWLQWTGIGWNGVVPETSPFVDLVDYEEDWDGRGGRQLYLRNRPIVEIAELAIDGFEIEESTSARDVGYVISADRRSVLLRGREFCRGIQNVHVAYSAGFESRRTSSRETIPASPGPYSVTIEDHWIADAGVTYFSSGDPLTKAGISPSVGEYYLDGAGQYLFNADDAEEEIVIAYRVAGTPPDVIQAVTQMVAENYKRRQWIGQAQQSIGGPAGGSINLRDWAIAPDVKMVLDFYSREGRAA